MHKESLKKSEVRLPTFPATVLFRSVQSLRKQPLVHTIQPCSAWVYPNSTHFMALVPGCYGDTLQPGQIHV